jgi:hypothetical protein
MIIGITNSVGNFVFVTSDSDAETYDAIISAQWSQSNGGNPNGVQEADLPAELQGVQPALMYDNESSGYNSTTSAWSPYRVGVNSNQPNVDTDGVGPDTKIIQMLSQEIPDKIYFFKLAPGGRGMKLDAVNANWNPASTLNSGYDWYKKFLYGQLEIGIRDIRLKQRIGIRRIKFANTYQIQGEQDGQQSDVSTYYYNDLTTWVNGMIDMLNEKNIDTSSMDYTLLQTHGNISAVTHPYLSDLRAAQASFVTNYKTANPTKSIGTVRLITTDEFGTVDGVHWNEDGVIGAGLKAVTPQLGRNYGSPTTYAVGNNQAQDAFYQVEYESEETLSDYWKNKIGNFIETIGDDEWTKFVCLILPLNTATLALCDLRGNADQGKGRIINNGATIVPDSHFEFNGTSHYLDPRLRPTYTAGVNYNIKFTQNNAEFGVFIRTNDDLTGFRSPFGAQGTSHFTVIQQPGSNRLAYMANDLTQGFYTNAADDYFNANTIYRVRRTASNARALLKGTTVLASDTQASIGLDGNYSLTVGAKNGSSISQYYDGGIKGFWMAEALNDSTVTALNTLFS